jgi:hypothetical protein
MRLRETTRWLLASTDFAYDGGGIGKGGTATISGDGKKVAKGRTEKTAPMRIPQEEGLDVGGDTGTR